MEVVDNWWPHRCAITIDRVIDGDTVVVLMPLVYSLVLLRWKVRLHGIDTPELHRGDDAHKEMGDDCRVLLERVLQTKECERLYMTVHGADSFGRLIATIYKIGTDELVNINDYMLLNGPGTTVYKK